MRLTCTLLQLHAVAHMDVIYSDVASGRVIKKPFKHHLDKRRKGVEEQRYCKSFFLTQKTSMGDVVVNKKWVGNDELLQPPNRLKLV